MRFKILSSLIFTFILIFFASMSTHAQRKGKSAHNKNNRSYYKKKYAKSTKRASAQCFQLYKNKNQKRNRKVAVASNKGKRNKQLPLAEVDINEKPIPASKPAPKPTAVATKVPETKPTSRTKVLSMTHQSQDDVLKKNDLPVPSTQKHKEIRDGIENHLKNFANEKPIKLEPLYFVTGQDEFAFVDMDPFLIAAEYAMHGKMILIEGYTDPVGDFKKNVALSIKRVEKIRQLMLDMGVPDENISIVGYGEELSNKSADTAQYQNDRRVDFTVF
ncbi:MAG TPA: OmpA family protein [Fulvivirga sp.]|nr:OmpA family protein [Fulvivirga sp.]